MTRDFFLLLELTHNFCAIVNICEPQNWADHVNYTLQKAWKALHFILCILKKGNNNTKCLAYTALVRPILEYEAVCWDPYREGQVGALNRVQKRAAKFANINVSGWETLTQRRLRPFQGIHQGTGLESDREQTSKNHVT